MFQLISRRGMQFRGLPSIFDQRGCFFGTHLDHQPLYVYHILLVCRLCNWVATSTIFRAATLGLVLAFQQTLCDVSVVTSQTGK